MNRPHKFAPGEYYHIYNRGTDKREIFLDIHDYHRFIILLYLCNNSEALDLQKLFREGRSFTELFEIENNNPLVAIGAWVIMPNHFHILIREKTAGGISSFLHKLKTSYCSYFNKKYDRKGSLFETTFKAEHANTDNYLKYLFSYIHLNPVKLIDPAWKENGIRDFNDSYKFLQNYEYSSYLDYLGVDRIQGKIIDKVALPGYFKDKDAVETEIFDWLTYKKRMIEEKEDLIKKRGTKM